MGGLEKEPNYRHGNGKKRTQLDEANGKQDTADERISKVEDRSEGIIWNAKQRNKDAEDMKETWNYLEAKMRSSNKFPVGENRGNGEQVAFGR